MAIQYTKDRLQELCEGKSMASYAYRAVVSQQVAAVIRHGNSTSSLHEPLLQGDVRGILRKIVIVQYACLVIKCKSKSEIASHALTSHAFSNIVIGDDADGD